MTIVCKMTQCPYYDNRGFCAKPTMISIDENGMCSVLWKRGQQRQLIMPFDDSTYYRKDFIEIIDAETQVSDVQ